MKKIILFSLLCILTLGWAQAQTTPDANGILYVKKGSTGNGSSWANALGEMAKALKDGTSLNSTPGTVKQIWVAAGTYYPLYAQYDGSAGAATTTDVTNSFVLLDNVKVYGGFAGTETDTAARDLTNTANASILSGDLNVAGTATDNAYHVVIASNLSGQVLLNGFTITGGYTSTATSSRVVNGVSVAINRGGGLYIMNASPYVTNVRVTGNTAYAGGGGVTIEGASSPVLTNIVVDNNVSTTTNTSTSMGGGIRVAGTGTPVLSNSELYSNAAYQGGGLYIVTVTAAFHDLNIHNNTATGGGGLYTITANSVLSNSIFKNNTATSIGGAIMQANNGILTLKNSVLEGNTSLNFGGGVYSQATSTFKNCTILNNKSTNSVNGNGGGGYFTQAASTLDSCRFWDNKAGNMGGGLFSSIALSVTHCSFLRDSAAYGGGVYNSGTTTFISDSIMGCYAATTGGGLYTSEGISAANVLIAGNAAASDGGGVLCAASNPCKFTNVTICGNKVIATGTVWGAISSTSPQTLQNCIVYGNSTGVAFSGSTTWSLLQDATEDAASHVINKDPSFVSPVAYINAPFTNGDYRLQNSSPVRDTGALYLYNQVSGATAVDLDGQPRISKDSIDLGAYELQFVKQAQTINAIADITATYGDAAMVLTGTATSGLTVSYSSANNAIAQPYQDAADGNKWKLKIKGAGAVNITASQAGNSYYNAAAPDVVFAVTVNKAALTVTAKDSVIAYTGAAFSGGNGAIYSGFVNGDDSTSALTGALTYSGTAQGAISRGTYTNTPAGLLADNYTITYANGKLVISLATDANGVLFVKKGGTGNGSSWANAVGEVADALKETAIMNAVAAGKVKQIWVAKGTYYPAYPANDATGGANTNTNRYNSFVLVKDTKIYGGFAGNETDTTGRNFTTNTTILSGDIGTAGTRSDNTYRVVIAAGEMGQALISGFTISGAYAEISGNVVVNGVNSNLEFGGGITVRSAALLIEDMVLTNNYNNRGAGAAVYAGSGDVMANATFRRVNITNNSGLVYGAGMYATYATVQLENCTGSYNSISGSASAIGGMFYFTTAATVYCRQSSFNNNTSSVAAGALYCGDNAIAYFQQSSFNDNKATTLGGAFYASGIASKLTFYKCEFLRDTCLAMGGAFSTASNANVLFENCTIKGCVAGTYIAVGYLNSAGSNVVFLNTQITGNYNTATTDYGIIRIANGTLKVINSTISGNNKTAILNAGSSPVSVLNSIIYGNGAGISGTYNAMYSTIQEATADAANHITDIDPLFVSSNAFTSAPFVGGNYSLQSVSPAINAGYDSIYHANDTITTDLAGNARFMGAAIDQGAYELQLASQTITALTDTTVVYGDVFTRAFAASSGLTVALSSADNTIAEVFQDAADNNSWKIKAKKAGVVNITMSQAGDATYAPATNVLFALTINKAALTVTAKDSTVVYSGTGFGGGNGIAYSGFVNGDDSTAALTGAVTYAGTSQGAKNVNTYAITPGGLSADNYAITYADGTLTISKAALTVAAKDTTKTYDGTGYTGGNGLTYTGFATGDDSTAALTGTVTYSGTSQGAKNVNTYIITPAGLSAANYTITYANGSLIINKAALTVTAKDSTKTYDGVAFGGGNGVSYTGFVTGDDSTAALTGNLTYTGTSQGAVDANAYMITPGGLSAGNYTINYVNGALTIDKAALTVTATDSTRVYDGTAFNGGNGVTYNGFVNGEDSTAVLTGTVIYSGTSQGAVNADSYIITPGGLSAGNYAISYTNGTLTIDKAALTITAKDSTKTYDGTAFNDGNGLEYAGFVTGDDSTAALTGTVTYSGTSQGAKDANTYVITPGGLTAVNYTISYANGSLTIDKAALTVTAKDSAKTYDGVAFGGGNGVSYTGFVTGDDSTAALTGTLAYSGSAQGATKADTYVITPGGLSADNYTISYANGALTIDKAALIVTAADSTKTYDGTAFSGGNGVTYSGFVNNEDSTAALTGTLAYSGTSQGAKDANIYIITPGGLTADNYAVSYTSGALQINQAALTITATDSAKTYDATTFSGGNGVTYSGFVPDEDAAVLSGNIAYSGTAQGAADAGSYSITASGVTSGNYAITYVDGALTIDKAALTITAKDSTKTYDGTAFNGGNGVTYSGLVSNEQPGVLGGTMVYTGTSQGAAHVNQYVITPGGVTSDNYTISFVNGALTIQPATVTITAKDTNRCYGVANPDYAFSYSGWVNSESVTVLTAQPTAASAATAQSAAGDYVIVPSGAAAADYVFTYVNGQLTVTPLPVSTLSASQGLILCGTGKQLPLQASGTYTFEWYYNNATVAGNTTGALTANAPGTYAAKATDTYGCSAMAGNNLAVTQLLAPQPAFSFDSYCKDVPVSFTNSSAVDNSATVHYNWESGNGQTSTVAAPEFTYAAAGTYNVVLKVSLLECPVLDSTVTHAITVEAPVPAVRLNTAFASNGQPLAITCRNYTTAAYSWTPATGLSAATVYNPTVTLNNSQTYEIAMTFPSGCVTTDTLLVQVLISNDILVPNVFTPNGDGQNDKLLPNLRGVEKLNYFRVFNRWGKKVFETSDAANGWDGYVNGELQPLATYVWVAEGVDRDGRVIHRQGSVTLLR
ncbi:gliding motility-associated C-terminal domain-containing protein [Filimonas lacunae]|uniref:Gliding motility-associated C-terminal domain-containing protein n=1 Tax=Filimonas lacunae TaxID=477680 RepID=A0A1N7PAP6_9BACT|nr:MBG domain-containing protein [Filimonas lacunae]SIT07692.1 gliding motility-associated C-terminal domain-containing protein [Filimonas lacunae]